jgi:hypothetical protein
VFFYRQPTFNKTIEHTTCHFLILFLTRVYTIRRLQSVSATLSSQPTTSAHVLANKRRPDFYRDVGYGDCMAHLEGKKCHPHWAPEGSLK